jgi:hypothetical protein
MENVGIFYVHVVYFTAIWYTLWTFGIFCGNLVYFVVYFSRFGMLYKEKSGNPDVYLQRELVPWLIRLLLLLEWKRMSKKSFFAKTCSRHSHVRLLIYQWKNKRLRLQEQKTTAEREN